MLLKLNVWGVKLMAATITINASEKVVEEFRRVAASVYGTGKGYLSKAVEEALSVWVDTRKKKSANEILFEMMDKGYRLGGINYKHRSELYD